MPFIIVHALPLVHVAGPPVVHGGRIVSALA
jgi:hypothetical protein